MPLPKTTLLRSSTPGKAERPGTWMARARISGASAMGRQRECGSSSGSGNGESHAAVSAAREYLVILGRKPAFLRLLPSSALRNGRYEMEKRGGISRGQV